MQNNRTSKLVFTVFVTMVMAIPCHGMISIDRGEIRGDILGMGGGYIHPFLTFSDNYTDNVYYDPDHRKSDYYTIFSPGILLIAPGAKAEDPGANILSISTPGGLMFSKDMDALERKIHARFLYNADIEDYRKYNDNDVTTINIEGGVQYNMKGGLSFDAVYQHNASYEDRSVYNSEGLNKYIVDLASVVLFYRPSEKMDFRMDFRLFDIGYDSAIDRSNDRRDKVISGYTFYKWTPKTSFYVRYDHFIIDYDSGELKNSIEYNYSAGVRWFISEKTNGRISVGYGIKDFKEESVNDSRDITSQIFLSNQLTGKSYVNFVGFRRTNETDAPGIQYLFTNKIMLGYFYRMNERIAVTIKLSYMDDQYQGGGSERRKDKSWDISPTAGYIYNQWLEFRMSYRFDLRNSNEKDHDYTHNGISMEIRAVL
ncbi:MAG: outer membrane beta-barrel protein [Proteobacteria bacterium]|nr:outer membrane beta-barrel protein [Pseudomonadota bacterium]